MKKNEMFQKAQWVCFGSDAVSVDAGKKFTASAGSSAVIRVVGLGFFELYINGKKVSDDLFAPLNTDFHEREIVIRDEPFPEKTAHRIYVSEYDISDYLIDGENTVAVMLGNGWYADDYQLKFGEKKLIFEIALTGENGENHLVCSDAHVLWRKNYITASRLTRGETHDYRGYADGFDFDAPEWSYARETDVPETDYLLSDCPCDKVTDILTPFVIKSMIGKKVYDIGVNTSGNVVLRLTGGEGSTATLVYSEEITDNHDLDMTKDFGQKTVFISDGKDRIVSQKFTWNAFRYFSLEGEAEVIRFERIHSGVAVDSSFRSDSETLNWIYRAYVNTQLSNMHAGIPSDCPHVERRGYTGDGQLAANASMTVLDAQRFYRKWIGDISDCQDRVSGHIQYTAPYTHSGGGPGGWGCAIVHVPFEYYRHYGDISFMRELYPQMKEYFRFLDDHSENGLIVSDVPDEWCLGDWCTARKIAIPEPFVNNYFYIRSINEILLLSSRMGLHDDEIRSLTDKKAFLIRALNDRYYDAATGDYARNVQGANAFAVDLGLGDERTFENLVRYYEGIGMYDTGIFGTDILTRVLFENRKAPLAFRLLTSEKMFSFWNIKRQNATTLWEYWTGRRSHSHPMFGAVAAYLFEFLLGIRYDNVAERRLVIAPSYPGCDSAFEGSEVIDGKTFAVKIRYTGKCASFDITVPEETGFRFMGTTLLLREGHNSFALDICSE